MKSQEYTTQCFLLVFTVVSSIEAVVMHILQHRLTVSTVNLHRLLI